MIKLFMYKDEYFCNSLFNNSNIYDLIELVDKYTYSVKPNTLAISYSDYLVKIIELTSDNVVKCINLEVEWYGELVTEVPYKLKILSNEDKVKEINRIKDDIRYLKELYCKLDVIEFDINKY